jgi:hypothetical protein
MKGLPQRVGSAIGATIWVPILTGSLCPALTPTLSVLALIVLLAYVVTIVLAHEICGIGQATRVRRRTDAADPGRRYRTMDRASLPDPTPEDLPALDRPLGRDGGAPGVLR